MESTLFDKEIENEDYGNEPITVPFDPNLIKIRRDPFTLGELIDKIQYNEVNFDTAFQRKGDLWDETKQSRLIESLLLRLPLPAFYFDEIVENENDITKRRVVWQVIDGLQRCCAFNNFIVISTLELTDLEFLKQFNDNHTKFNSLPRDLQRRIMQTPLTVYIVEKGTPDEVKFNIFKRINTGGLILNAQEIRHAMNQGISATFVKELAELKSFKKATCNKIESERMTDRDFVTRFVSFYLLDYKNYQPDLDSFMSKGMAKIKSLTDKEREQLKKDFEKSMVTSKLIFGDDAFRKRSDINERKKPINKALFEVLSCCFAKSDENTNEILVKNRDVFVQRFIELNRDSKFMSAISSGTGQKESVKYRFEQVNRIINETVGIL